MSRVELPDNYVQLDGALLNVNFTAATISGGTKTTDTTRIKNSAGSLKVTPTGNYCECKKALTTPIKFGTGCVIGLWIYLENGNADTVPGGIPYINLEFADSAGYYTNIIRAPFSGYHLKWNQWNYLNIHLDDTNKWSANTSIAAVDFTGSATVNMTVDRINIILGAMDGQSINAYIDSIEINQRSRPKILIGFDAISTNLTNAALPLLQAAGITGYATFNNSSTNVSQAQTWRDAGWEIINHGYTHTTLGPMTTDAAVIAEVEQNWNAMVANGLVVSGQIKGWLGPENSYSPRSSRVLAELGYKFARNYKGLITKPTIHGVDSLLNMGSYDFGNPSSLSRLLNLLDAPIAYGGTVWFFVHEVNITTPATGPTGSNNTIYIDDLTAIINKLVKLRDAGLVDLMKPSDWYKGLTQSRVLA